MKAMKISLRDFNTFERVLWTASVTILTISYVLSGLCLSEVPIKFLSALPVLVTSVIGVTAVLICGKGLPLGQALLIVFAVLYGIISFRERYYGEMITYMGMSAPMAALSLAEWIKNPASARSAEVKTARLKKYEPLLLLLLTIAVTAVFYFILKALNTANLFWSTVSIATSFGAAYLTFRRNPFYALVYAMNDLVLIVLWAYAAMKDISAVTTLICFIVFFANDIYGFVNWRRIERRQSGQDF